MYSTCDKWVQWTKCVCVVNHFWMTRFNFLLYNWKIWLTQKRRWMDIVELKEIIHTYFNLRKHWWFVLESFEMMAMIIMKSCKKTTTTTKTANLALRWFSFHFVSFFPFIISKETTTKNKTKKNRVKWKCNLFVCLGKKRIDFFSIREFSTFKFFWMIIFLDLDFYDDDSSDNDNWKFFSLVIIVIVLFRESKVYWVCLHL